VKETLRKMIQAGHQIERSVENALVWMLSSFSPANLGSSWIASHIAGATLMNR
jgi:hypothetical protein